MAPIKARFYGNYTCIDADGKLMFRCDKKKKDWYFKRGLIEIDKTDPFIFKLLFKPKGLGHHGDPFFLQERKNQCVVCGETESLTRHHVVPHCYRRFYPQAYNRFGSYDVMMLCTYDHKSYEHHSFQFKLKIADKYDAPIHGVPKNCNDSPEPKKIDPKISGYALALLKHSDKIPLERKEILKKTIKEYTDVEGISNDLNYLIAHRRIKKIEIITHSEIVMSKIGDINLFNIEWRKHFNEIMQPEFLPEYWNIERKFELS